MKLALGTAQFGLPYGIASLQLQIPYWESNPPSITLLVKV